MTPDGPTLWNHNVLLFGAVSSVWAYNRFGDILCLIARTMLAVPALHYVDDYGAAEPPHSAPSGFTSFKECNNKLGFEMKTSKEQPEAYEQRVQGVQLTFKDAYVQVAPTDARVTSMTTTMQHCMARNHLSPHEAAQMAGKLVFLSTTVFGRVGRAATKPIYGRQYSPSPNQKLTKAIRDALLCLQHVLRTAPPRQIPWDLVPVPCNFLYADAFFDLGDKRYRPSDHDIPERWEPKSAHHLHNGWGTVFFPRRPNWPEAVTMRGEVPPKVLQQYCTRQAFIYFLEAWAQVLPSIAFNDWLDDAYIAFVDNDAAKHALIKGYGTDEQINCLLGMYWAFQAEHRKSPWLERVTSEANLSDEISRDDFSLHRERDWLHIEVDLAETYEILTRAADSIHFSVAEAHKLIAASVQPLVRRALAQAGLGEDALRHRHKMLPGFPRRATQKTRFPGPPDGRQYLRVSEH